MFTPRQLTALVTFSDLIGEVVQRALVDALEAGMGAGNGLEAGGDGGRAYAEAVGVYLAANNDKVAEALTQLTTWSPVPKLECVIGTFRRHAIAMVWDFAEANPFALSGGSFEKLCDYVCKALGGLPSRGISTVVQQDATTAANNAAVVISSDPPYYDNVPYADLSDFFYVWLRRSLRQVFPSLTSTVLVPKSAELVAEPFRHGGKEAAESFFMGGMSEAVRRMAATLVDGVPAAIYYAFKQAEGGSEAVSSTGWEAFLQALGPAGFSVVGTWPVRTERGGRMRDQGSNALASSIVLVCRKRQDGAPTIDRTTFRRLLRQELPAALRHIQKGNIAPVDMAQASIGPGMAIFSRNARVLEPDGSAMSVRTALQLINQALDEYLTEQEGEFDAETRFAVTWFETRQFESGAYGEAETLAKARNVAVSGVAEAGIAHSAGGKVRLLRRDELPDDWNPATDKRPTIWEATQHLIKRLESKGESGAAELLATLGAMAAPARDLAYRLYTTCERKKWADEARAYNGLVVSWPEVEKLAAQVGTRPSGKPQMDLL